MLKEIFRSDLIQLPEEKNKIKIIKRLVDLLFEKGLIKDKDALLGGLIYREDLMSTGIGLGIGIPHLRFEEIKNPVIAVALQPEGIADYESLDEQPVRLVILILVAKHQHKEHIKLLSEIIAHLKKNDVLPRIFRATDPQNIYDLLLNG